MAKKNKKPEGVSIPRLFELRQVLLDAGDEYMPGPLDVRDLNEVVCEVIGYREREREREELAASTGA